MKREIVNEKLRFIVLYRDCFTCQRCGKYDYSNTLWKKYSSHEIHHIRTNQSNAYDNLITLCPSCHFTIHGGDWKNKPFLTNKSIHKIDDEMVKNALLIKEIIDFDLTIGRWGFTRHEFSIIDREEKS